MIVVVRQYQFLSRVERHGRADIVSGKWQFSQPAIDQHGKFHARGAAKIEQFIQCRPQGAAGIEHIVDQQNMAPLYTDRHIGGFFLRVQANPAEIVAMQGHRQRS